MGQVFDIQRFSTHDGPGIRTTVFFKGCPLRCFWCQNPEGLTSERQLQFTATRCVLCAECAKICSAGVHVLAGDSHEIRRQTCRLCGECAEVCLPGALTLVGDEREVADILAVVLQDRVYYDQSGGGVTLSGGEPLMQPDFARSLLTACREAGIHTALDSSLCCAPDALTDILPLTDLLLVDIKHVESPAHQRAIGRGNEQILANAHAVSEAGVPIIIRVPVVPSFNDSPAAIRAIAEFAAGLRTLQHLELLPFHRLGEAKYEGLGVQPPTSHLEPVPRQRVAELADAARSAGISVKVAGGEEG